MTKPEIIQASEAVFRKFSETCGNIEEAAFFAKPGPKWSIAENVQHLIISTNMTGLAYRIPRFLVRWIGGTPNRNSRSLDELKEKYYKKLSEGGQASARYIPKPIKVSYGRQKLIENWNRSTARYLSALATKRTEKDLDNYLATHPLLGRITLRELCYFTVIHTEHHLTSIQNITPSS